MKDHNGFPALRLPPVGAAGVAVIASEAAWAQIGQAVLGSV